MESGGREMWAFWGILPKKHGIPVAELREFAFRGVLMSFIVVRRGALSTYRLLEKTCKEIGGIRVIWDRRREPLRTVEHDRRSEAPHSWTAADHVLVREEDTLLAVGTQPTASGEVFRR